MKQRTLSIYTVVRFEGCQQLGLKWSGTPVSFAGSWTRHGEKQMNWN
jgi:hypothetical protein